MANQYFIPTEQRKEAIALREKGLNSKDIAHKLNCSLRRVQQIFHEDNERMAVPTRCCDCPAIIRRFVRTREVRPAYVRCAACAAKLWQAKLKAGDAA